MSKKIIFVVFLILLFLGSFWLGYKVKSEFFLPLSSGQSQTLNLLLLGENGAGGSGADLTDTIIFASLNGQTKKAVFVSIPRDLWIKEIQAKINTVYHYGGNDLAKKTIEEILGQKIDYVLVVNFDSFEKLIDLLGGIEVDVKNSFDDYKYPIAGREDDLCDGDKELKCRYEHLHFDVGRQFMDGKTALKFVRSRNAAGDEGTDFARSARQQQVMKAVEEKIHKSWPEVAKKAPDYYQFLKTSMKIDFPINQTGSLVILLTKLNWGNLNYVSINGNLLFNPRVHSSKQWVLLPKSGDFGEIQKFVSEQLK